MNISDFAEHYTLMADEELLRTWADHAALVPEARVALQSELQRRGLKEQDAARIKKRMDVLAARDRKGLLVNQVDAAKYERNMRHFDGWKEPEFYSPYIGGRDIRNVFAYVRHKYRVWKAFRDHTGYWPSLSISFHFLSWIALVFGIAKIVFWVETRNWGSGWSTVVIIGCAFALLGARTLGARLMRKLDWDRYGS